MTPGRAVENSPGQVSAGIYAHRKWNGQCKLLRGSAGSGIDLMNPLGILPKQEFGSPVKPTRRQSLEPNGLVGNRIATWFFKGVIGGLSGVPGLLLMALLERVDVGSRDWRSGGYRERVSNRSRRRWHTGLFSCGSRHHNADGRWGPRADLLFIARLLIVARPATNPAGWSLSPPILPTPAPSRPTVLRGFARWPIGGPARRPTWRPTCPRATGRTFR